MLAAAVQLNSRGDKARNLEVAERLVRGAAQAGAELVVLPEKWNLIAAGEEMAAGAEGLDGPSITAARDWARELGIRLVAGTIVERVEGQEKTANTSVLIDADGELVATYRKIHMFDVEVGGTVYRESDHGQGGEQIVVADAGEVPIGLAVCYDLRFPELLRILAVRGARVVALPAAFTVHTGRDHWQVLIRARAIEDQVFMVAAGQIGEAPPDHSSYGRSMIVDPWGVVLATAPDEECFVTAELDFELQDRIREKLPSLANRRPEVYQWPEELRV